MPPVKSTLSIGVARSTVERGPDWDEVTVMNGIDDPRTPSDLAEQLQTAELLDAFESMAPSHRREYIDWIEEAKRDTTRQRRLEETVRRLSDHGM